MSGEVKLMPCAHCESADVELRESITDACVACNNCGCRTGFVYFGADDASNAFRKREAAAVWNHRPTVVTDEVVERGREALADARQAIASLDEDALGMAQIAFGTPGVDVYPIRNELLAKIDAAIAAMAPE